MGRIINREQIERLHPEIQLPADTSSEPQMTRKDTVIPAQTTSVRVIDTSRGAIVVKGGGAYGGGGTANVTIQGTLTPQQTQSILKERGITPTSIMRQQTIQQQSQQPIIQQAQYSVETDRLTTNIPTIEAEKQRIQERIIQQRQQYEPKVEDFFKKAVSPIISLEKKKAEEKQELLNRYLAGEKLTFLEKQKISAEIRAIEKSEQEPKPKGWSLTQKYYELFGVKFYAEGEREKRVAEGIKDLTQAQTYEEQQKAIQSLKEQGLKIEKVGEEYVIDKEEAYKTFAPTSKTASILINLTDLALKSTIFSPLMKTGAAAKQEQVIRYKRQFEPPEEVKKAQAEALIKKYEDIYVKKGREALEKELVKTWKELKTEEGKQGFKVLLNELIRKEIIRVPVYNVAPVRTQFPEIELTFELTKFPHPSMEHVAEVTTAAGLIQQKQPTQQITFPARKQITPLNVDDLIKAADKQIIKAQEKTKQIQKAGTTAGLIDRIIQSQPEPQKFEYKEIQKPALQQPPTIKIPERISMRQPTFPAFPTFTFKKPKTNYKQSYNKLKAQLKKAESAYTASLGAAFFQAKPIKISKKKYKRLSKVRFTGFETRPVFTIEDDDKKRDKAIQKQIKKAVSF